MRHLAATALFLALVATAAAAEPHRVLVVGGGYGGVEAASRLARQKDTEVVLVDQNPHHTLVARLPESSVHGTTITRPLAAIARGRGFTFEQGTVSSIDLGAKRVELGGDRALTYDSIVVALGGVTSLPPIPGLAAHAQTLRALPDADRLRARVTTQLAKATRTGDLAGQRTSARFVVVGGGATGVELASELAEELPQMARRAGLAPGVASVVLVERAPKILPGMRPQTATAAERRLRSLGVEVRVGAGLRSLDADRAHLDDGSSVAADTFVWAGGARAPDVLARSGLPIGAQGRVRVDQALRIAGARDAYAIGDGAVITTPGGELLATTVENARSQGRVAATNIGRTRAGRAPELFRARSLGAITSLGRKGAAGHLLGRVDVVGRVASALKRAAELRYEVSLRMAASRGRARAPR